MAKEYAHISTSEPRSSYDSGLLPEPAVTTKVWHFRHKPGRTFLIVLAILVPTSLLLTMVAETFIFWSIISKERVRESYLPTGLSPERNIQREIYSPTKYSSENRSEADAAWNAIHTGHGVVAIDKQWAADRNLVNSVTWPEHPEQSLYVIEAYHVLHCAKNIRDHYLTLLDGKERYWEIEHDNHCFDTIRQHIMCNADDTLLRTTGHQDAGRGQIVSCKNWDALRKWAGERSSCYDDHEPTVDNPRFGVCGRGDGLPVGSVLE